MTHTKEVLKNPVMKKLHPDQIEKLSLDFEHITVLASYAASEVFAAFNPNEARAIREVAKEIGKTSASVGEHVKKLVECGLIMQVGIRKRRSRIEALYAHKGLDTHLPASGQPLKLKEKYVERFKGQMRLLDRQHEAMQNAAHVDNDFYEYFIYQWQHVYLSPENAQLIKERIKETNRLALQLNEGDPTKREDGEYVRCSVTGVMIPTQVESRRRLEKATKK